MAHFGIALPMIANSILLLNLHNVQSEVFDTYLNGAIASVIASPFPPSSSALCAP